MGAPKPSGKANTKEGKIAILERTKALLSTSQLVITVPFEGVSKEQTDMLRKEMGKKVKASVVKNALMRKALEDTPFAAMGPTLKNENIFFFIPEGEAKPAYEGFKRWQKEVKRNDPNQEPKTAIMDSVLYTGAKTIEGVTKLPTKLELITKIAQGIKAVPTKVGRGIAAPGNKLGRAFSALRNKLEEEGK
jgi:large subunit ribosomal protein L10